MRKVILIVCALFTMLFMACGSVNTAYKQAKELADQTVPISVQTIPNGAKVYVDGKLVSTTTPTTINVPNAVLDNSTVMNNKVNNKGQARAVENNLFNIQIVKEGYETIKDIVAPKAISKPYVYELSWPENIIYELKMKERTDAYQKDPTIPAGAANERVTRDTSGNTALERTIIRWYFDSAPQGARIYWRVISSVPAEVKNTNELWLGSTPFEETRAFNIQGLTYENSRDVQIEIKVKRKGYVDQNKRFNVRQAIDQQEISSFFDMVEE